MTGQWLGQYPVNYAATPEDPRSKGNQMKRSAARRRYKAFASGLASMAIALGLAAIPAQAATPQRDVDYVALGDSYTAGTGADTSGLFVPTPPCTQTAGGYVDI